MARTESLRPTGTWQCALAGGLLALPFTALEAWRSTGNVSLGTVVVGGALAGYLVKRHGGYATATGLRAGLIGGFPAVRPLGDLLRAVATVPNPPWFRAVGGVTTLAVGGVVLGMVAASGGLGGRFGGWLAERRGHGDAVDADGTAERG